MGFDWEQQNLNWNRAEKRWVHWKKTVEGRFHKDFPWDLNGDFVGFALW